MGATTSVGTVSVEPVLIDAIGSRIERTAGRDTGLLVTDHDYQPVMPPAACVLWQKQCDRLDGEARNDE